MSIFMIVYDKAVNQNTGTMNAKSVLPVVLLKYEKDVTVELPDYGIEKLRDGK